ncbi:LysR family transcriptional regulator [Hamadaea sp. NPDC051192]|uniref:LysR family transcriptional regulator n=1 Tax=Hamadaea sp. NPDC051192 TaxID=3154940 RepID=UPI003446CFD1
MDLEIRHLRAICAIADAGSLSKAAVHLGITQPALTTLLQRIERSVGGPLFVRGRTGIQPTALGEQAAARARLVLSELDGFIGSITHGDRKNREILLGSAHMECVGSMLTYVRQALPDTEFALQVEPSAVVLAQALAHRRLDIALIGFMEDQGVPLASDLAQRTFIPRLPVLLAISAQHPLAVRDDIDLADLRDEFWICPPGADDGSLTSLRTACHHAGFEPKIRYQVPSGGGRPLISSGQAVQLVEPSSNPLGGIAIRRLTGDPLGMRLVFAWRRQSITDARAGAIYGAAAKAYAEAATASPAYAPWWYAHPEVHPC